MKPVECPECEMLAFRHGRCSHCAYEDESDLSTKAVGLRGIARTRTQLAEAASKKPTFDDEEGES